MADDVQDVAVQVQKHLDRWNPAPTDGGLRYVVGEVPDEGDTRATVAADNPLASGTGDNQVQYGDDADGDGDGEADGDDDGEAVDYGDLSKDELKDALAERDLPVSGTKDELIARLEEDDASEDD